MTFPGSNVDWKICEDPEPTVKIPTNEHAVYFTLGTGAVYCVRDSVDPGALDLTPIQRAVLVARLRAIATLLEAETAPA